MLYFGHSSFKSLINISDDQVSGINHLYTLFAYDNSAEVKLRQSHSHKGIAGCQFASILSVLTQNATQTNVKHFIQIITVQKEKHNTYIIYIVW